MESKSACALVRIKHWIDLVKEFGLDERATDTRINAPAYWPLRLERVLPVNRIIRVELAIYHSASDRQKVRASGKIGYWNDHGIFESVVSEYVDDGETKEP
jgi:hypothetical protein